MKTLNRKLSSNIVSRLFLMLIFVGTISCSNDDDGATSQSSDTKFYITDAPTDNTNVSGVVVTIADVKVNGVSVENFTRTTIDLMQYQNGLTQLLGDLELQSGNYANIELVLDYDVDASGNTPGAYVELVNGAKDEIQAAANSIVINDGFQILPSLTNNIVLDFDIRKAITTDGSGNFELVTMGELSNSIRIVNQELSGEISGIVTDTQNSSERIIVYAYEAGTFDANVETQGQGASNIMFANAITSATVNEFSGNYELNFLNNGDYELHFVSYNDTDNDGEFEFNAMLDVESAAGIDLGNINVSSEANIDIAVTVMGTL